MKKTRVVFMGSRPLGHFALELLQSISHVEVVAVVAKEPSSSAWWEKDPFYIASGNILNNHSELINLEFDFGVSINYWKIIESEIIKKPRLGFINLHHSYNLCLRGRNMTSHAILTARRLNRWYHGTSLHYTDDGLDTGPIIASRSCELTETDTSWTLFNKVESLGEDLLKEWLPRLTQAKVPAAYPEANHPLSLRFDDSDKFIRDIHVDPLYAFDFVRAFDFNNHYEAAYTFIDEKKVYLTTDHKFGSHAVLEIDNNRIIYASKELK
jgi:methionyl-tRNA formyltransferase